VFNANMFLDFVQKDIKKAEKWKKIMREYLRSTDFYGWLFNPSKGEITDYSGIIEGVYGGICDNPRKLELLCELIEDEPNKFGRSTATFLLSVVNFGIDSINAAYKGIDRQFAEGDLKKREAESKQDQVRKYAEIVERLNDALLSIVKKDAKKLAKETGLPKAVCKMALKQVPDPCFINNPKVGVYLNTVLANMYQMIDHRDTDLDDVDWKLFFDTLFGKESRYEVASFILLETNKHIESLSSKKVRKVWDSLTAFALDTLDRADNNSREHVLEVYIKRLARALENGEHEVRVDLRSLSESAYPNLTKTICRYRDKFDDLFRPLSVSNLID